MPDNIERLNMNADTYRHMGLEPPAIPTRFYVLITLEKAVRQWRESGKRNTFLMYVKTLEFLGYKVI